MFAQTRDETSDQMNIAELALVDLVHFLQDILLCDKIILYKSEFNKAILVPHPRPS